MPSKGIRPISLFSFDAAEVEPVDERIVRVVMQSAHGDFLTRR